MGYKGFSQVELRRPTRSTFDMSHEKRVSSRLGKLTPVFITETMPNDTWHGSTEVLVKLAPMKAPIFHRMNLFIHHFFVPNRLLWDGWEDFITGGRLGEAVTSPPVPPRFLITDIQAMAQNWLNVGSISDYLGIPPIDDGAPGLTGRTLDAMPHAAFYKIWYDYYRDRNYVDNPEETLPMPSGTIDNTIYTYLMPTKQRCWEHDYFTSAMLSTQRGAEVLMPLSGTGTVTYLNQSLVKSAVDGSPMPTSFGLGVETGGDPGLLGAGVISEYEDAARIENIDQIDLTSSDVSINDLRRAVRLQEWLERNQLAGSRYNESIMAHFGRKTSDSRLQRAEYLGGGKAVIQVSEVLTTAFSVDSDDEVVPPAAMSGRGSAYANTNRFHYNCEEHGFIISVLSVLPTSGYMQGLPRMFQNRNTFLEYPWPSFAHLGEQEVYDNEIYMDATSLPADRTAQPLFGYQSRYADWKNIPSSSHGDFRTSLDFWHLTRLFTEQPTLSNTFVEYDDENQDRVFNVSESDTLWMYIYNSMKVKRSLPYFGTPML